VKKDPKKVSIFIPTYNDAKNLDICIQSVLNQEYKFDEIIVVNDCSTDNTNEILKKYNQVTIINNLTNKGVSYSRNIGIKKCKNEIIAGIDSDVELEKNWLKKILTLFFENKAVYCCGFIEEKYINNIYNKWRSIRFPLNWGFDNIKNPPYIFTNNTLQYKYVWEKINGFDENYHKPGGEDIDYSKKVLEFYKDQIFYFFNVKSKHLANDTIKTLANRVWRYHSYSYKIKKISFYRFIKLTIKELNFLIKRSLEDILRLRFKFILINFYVFIIFLKLEICRIIKKK